MIIEDFEIEIVINSYTSRILSLPFLYIVLLKYDQRSLCMGKGNKNGKQNYVESDILSWGGAIAEIVNEAKAHDYKKHLSAQTRI